MLGESAIFHTGGTRRARATAETLAALHPLLARFGITRVANITGLDRIGIPVAVAVRPGSRSLVVSQGKGMTLVDAKVSAIMESIELFHAERPAIAVRVASLRDLQAEGVAVVDRGVGDRPHPQSVIGWTQGRDLATGALRFVPYASVAIDDSVAAAPVPAGLAVNSNGLASGNTLDEAIVHGLCELIERDAIALWHHLPDDARRGRAVTPSTIDDPSCRALLARYEAARIDVHVFDLTSDIGLPVYEVFIRERGEGSGDRSGGCHAGERDAFSAVGSGCHRWRGIALSRALTEAAQCRLTHIAGAREDLVHGDYAAGPERLAQVARFRAIGDAPLRPFRTGDGAVPDAGESFAQGRADIVAALRAVGIADVVAVDLSVAGTGIHVARLVVPGLEGLVFDADYRPGRRARAVLARGMSGISRMSGKSGV